MVIHTLNLNILQLGALSFDTGEFHRDVDMDKDDLVSIGVWTYVFQWYKANSLPI